MDLTSMDVASPSGSGSAPSSYSNAPPKVTASATDVDDEPTIAELGGAGAGTGSGTGTGSGEGSSPATSANGSGSGSGGEWETLTDEGKAARGAA